MEDHQPNEALAQNAEHEQQVAIARRELLDDGPCQRLRTCAEHLIRLEVKDIETFREYALRILTLTNRITGEKRRILELSADGNQVRDETSDEEYLPDGDLAGSRLMHAINAFIACEQLRLLPALGRAVNNAANELIP